MNVGNCPECGKLYAKNAMGMCHDCYRLEEENEAKVAEFVRDNPKSSIDKIHEATGIKEKTIFRMIKSGRFIDAGSIAYPCESCGAPIYEGRICAACNQNLVRQLKDMEAKRIEKQKNEVVREKKRGTGMHTKNM